jgi:hypothetical protein
VAGHLLTFEDFAWILTLAGGAVRAVRNGDAVRGAQTAEVPALHGAGEALADGDAGDVDLLAGNKMVGAEFGADRQEVVFGNAEFARGFWIENGRAQDVSLSVVE